MAAAGTALALYLMYLVRGVLELIVLAVFLALRLGRGCVLGSPTGFPHGVARALWQECQDGVAVAPT